VEESNETPEKAKAILKTRVGRHNDFKGEVVKAIFLETFNPNKGHVHRDYYKPWKEKTMPSYRAFIPALPGDNPYLPEAYIENLKRADKTTRERLLNGNFDYDADPMRLMNYDAIVDMKTNTLPEPAIGVHKQKYLINDIARFGGDKIVLGEFEDLTLTGLSVYTYQGTEETEQKIKDQAQESRIPFSHILSDEDGIGGGVVDHLKGTKGFNGNSRPREMLDTFTGKFVHQNFTNLRSQCYFRLSELVNDRLVAIKLRYFKTNIEGFTQEMALTQLEEELDAVKRLPNEASQNNKHAVIPKDDMKEALGRSPDFADVLMMRMLFEFKPPSDMEQRAMRKRSQQKVVINRAL
jgi:hypothetical protein